MNSSPSQPAGAPARRGAGDRRTTARGASAAAPLAPMPLPPPSRPSSRRDDLLAQPVQRGSAGLLVVGDDRVRRVEPGHGRDLVQDVGALERHAGADPRRGRHGDVGLVGRDRARAHDGGVQVGDAADHGRAGRDAELGGDLGQQRAEHGARRDELGQPGAVAPRPRDERIDVPERRAEPVVGEPRGDHRRRRRGGPAGEPQARDSRPARGSPWSWRRRRAAARAAAASGRWGRRRSASALRR